MTMHNRVWTAVIVLLWLTLLGSAFATGGFRHPPSDWATWESYR